MIIVPPANRSYPATSGAPGRSVSVPFLRQTIGAGDAVAAFTAQLGMQPCTPCEERRRKLNQLFTLQPWGQR